MGYSMLLGIGWDGSAHHLLLVIPLGIGRFYHDMEDILALEIRGKQGQWGEVGH